MGRCRVRSFLTVLVAAAALGCAQGEAEPGEDDGQVTEDTVVIEGDSSEPPQDTVSPSDSALPTGDTGADAGLDAGTTDTGTSPDMDTGLDAGIDTGFADTGFADTGRFDTGFADTGTRDTGFPDTGFPDTGTVVADTGVARTCPSGFSTQSCRVRENCCAALAGIPTGCGCSIPIIGCVPRGGPGCD